MYAHDVPLAVSACPMAIALKTGKTIRNADLNVQQPDGAQISVRVQIDPLYDDAGRRCGAIGVIQEVTDLKQAEKASQHLAALVESSDDAIITKDLNGTITSWNQAAEELFGYSREEAIGNPVTMLIPQEHVDEEPEILKRIRRGERIEHYETVRQRKDGSSVDISLTVSPIKNSDGGIIGASKISRDVTKRKEIEAGLRGAREELAKANEELEKRVHERTAELKQANAALLSDMEEHVRLETQLRQSQKMETIGTLAGGIAHDFNNVLNIVKGYTNSIATHPALDGEIAEQIKVIEEATERGSSVVRQLLTLARKTQSHLVSTNVNEVISGLRNLLKQTLPKTIDIALELDAKLPVAMADPHQLTQALLNLCVNARDAMPDGGKLTIKTFVITGTEEKDAGTQAKPYLCIEVIDTGIGMTDSVRSRIFEPFYTTKEIGDGTGLGLSIVYGIVKNHNGSIDALSTSGEGSTFRMCLPVASSQQIGMDEGLRSRAIQKQPRHQRTVLLVEDEEMMVLLMKKVLGKNGYTVLVALDGQKALDLFDLHKHEIDVVLLDMGLPKKSGWNVILKMKEDKPDARIVVSSGYIDLDLKTRMNQAGVTDFIDKPYTPLDVVELLDTVVERNLP